MAPLGDASVGGVARHLTTLARGLALRGHAITVLAPRGSSWPEATSAPGLELVEAGGTPQPSAARSGGALADGSYPIPPDALVAALWRAAFARQDLFDVIVNFGHDWLPFYVGAMLRTPVAHIVNLCAGNAATDAEIRRVAATTPGRVAMLSQSQAASFELDSAPLMPPAVDGDLFRPGPGGPDLVFAGRITPEKGLTSAAAIAERAGRRLIVAGGVEDDAHARAVRERFGEVVLFAGFLDAPALAALLGRAAALVHVPDAPEAFGIVTLEALACATPVLAWNGDATAELIAHGTTGFLADKGDLDALAACVQDLDRLDRAACRNSALAFAPDRSAMRAETWLRRIAAGKGEMDHE